MNAIVATAGIQRCVHDKENPYLMLSVGVTRDSKLSVEDLGFLTILLDHPNNFIFNVSYLVKRCKLSKEKTRKLINRLIEAGYIIATQVRKSGKFLGMIYRVFEKPLQLVKGENKPASKDVQKPDVEDNAVCGETKHGNSTTNEYDDGISTSTEQINKNVCISLKEDKSLKVKIDNQALINALLIRGCKAITDQKVLDAYLEEFNKKSDQFKSLTDVQRISNLALFIKRCVDHHKNNNSKAKAEAKPTEQTNAAKSIKQAFHWAKQLCANSTFASKFAHSGETTNAFEGRIRQNILIEKHFIEYKPFLAKIGLIIY